MEASGYNKVAADLLNYQTNYPGEFSQRFPELCKEKPDATNKTALHILKNLLEDDVRMIANAERMNPLEKWNFMENRSDYLLHSEKAAQIGLKILEAFVNLRSDREKMLSGKVCDLYQSIQRLFAEKASMSAQEREDNFRSLFPEKFDFSTLILEGEPAGRTLLHEACRNFDPPLIKFFLELGISPSKKDHNGQTPIDLLVQEGADTVKGEHLISALNEVKSYLPEGLFEQFFNRACQKQDWDAANKMVDYCTDDSKISFLPLQEALKDEAIDDPSDKKIALIRKLVISFPESGCIRSLENLIDLKIGLTIPEASNFSEIKKLITICPENVISLANQDKFTLVIWAAEEDPLFLQKILQQNPELIHVPPVNEYRTPLNYACAKGNAAMIQLFLKCGADASEPDGSGFLPIQLACEHGLSEAVYQDLLKRYPDSIHAKTTSQESLLHILCQSNAPPSLVSSFLKWGADPYQSDVRGEMPIHAALKRGKADTVELLLRNDPRLFDVEDGNKKSIIYHIMQNRLTSLLQIFPELQDRLFMKIQEKEFFDYVMDSVAYFMDPVTLKVVSEKVKKETSNLKNGLSSNEYSIKTILEFSKLMNFAYLIFPDRHEFKSEIIKLANEQYEINFKIEKLICQKIEKNQDIETISDLKLWVSAVQKHKSSHENFVNHFNLRQHYFIKIQIQILKEECEKIFFEADQLEEVSAISFAVEKLTLCKNKIKIFYEIEQIIEGKEIEQEVFVQDPFYLANDFNPSYVQPVQGGQELVDPEKNLNSVQKLILGIGNNIVLLNKKVEDIKTKASLNQSFEMKREEFNDDFNPFGILQNCGFFSPGKFGYLILDRFRPELMDDFKISTGNDLRKIGFETDLKFILACQAQADFQQVYRQIIDNKIKTVSALEKKIASLQALKNQLEEAKAMIFGQLTAEEKESTIKKLIRLENDINGTLLEAFLSQDPSKLPKDLKDLQSSTLTLDQLYSLDAQKA